MKAIIPRKFKQLKPSDQKKILSLADEQVSKNCTIMLDIYLKMSCLVLHDAFGFGEKRLNCYLGNYRRLFKKHAKLVRNGEQIEFLDKRMREIFKQNGYPDEFFRTIVDGWDIDTNNKGDI